jgi:aminoglycoside phosphotransferase (APT) family kinase protein
MKTDTHDIDKQQLLQTINREVGLGIRSIRFVPKGEDAYSYLAEGVRAGDRYFIRAQDASRAGALEPVYAITNVLHTRYGLSSVVAPIATRRGTFTICHGRYTVAVFGFIVGRTLYDQGATVEDLAQAAGIMAALHQCEAARDYPNLQREAFENPFRAPIMRALGTVERSAPYSGRYQHQLVRLLQAEQTDILATFVKMDQSGVRAKALSTDWVLTHGDPNLDNLLKDGHGQLHLTDWGEIALGPPERDLFAFTGEGFEAFLRTYKRLRQHVVLHAEIFAFYFYRWTMQEIADYATRILFERRGQVEDEHAWAELQPYLPIRHDHIAQGLRELQAVLERVLG